MGDEELVMDLKDGKNGAILFKLFGFDASPVGESAATVAKPAYIASKVVVKSPSGVEICHDFLVLHVSVLESLQRLFSLFCGRVALTGAGESCVCFFDLGRDMILFLLLFKDHSTVAIVALEALFEQVLKLSRLNLLHWELSFQASRLYQNHGI